MNIFTLSDDLEETAQWHADKHVVKMPVEAMQICSTVLAADDVLQKFNILYKPTHKHHPIVKWAAESNHHLMYVICYGVAVANEYKYRYNRTHGSYSKLMWLYNYHYMSAYPVWASQPLCMPDEYKINNDVTTSYRNYYSNAKAHIHKWTARNTPSWIIGSRTTTAVGT